MMLGNCPIAPPGGWGSQRPPLGVGIEWGHPLACGLRAAWFPILGATGGCIQDVTGCYSPSSNLASWAMTGIGPALHWVSGDGKAITLPVLPFGQTGTLIATFRFTNFSTNGMVLNQNNDAANILQLASYYQPGNTFYFGWYAGNSEYRVTGTPAYFGIAAGVFCTVAMSWNVATKTTRVYVNGVQKGSRTNALVIYSPTSGPTLSINTSFSLSGDVARLLWYDRELSSVDIQELYASPYCMFESGAPMAGPSGRRPLIEGSLASATQLTGAIV
jgi:hypothetical protein